MGLPLETPNVGHGTEQDLVAFLRKTSKKGKSITKLSTENMQDDFLAGGLKFFSTTRKKTIMAFFSEIMLASRAQANS